MTTRNSAAEQRAFWREASESSRHHLRGQIRGEARLTPTGVPVVWDLVLTSEDSYKWRRTDWMPFGYTQSIERCPAGTAPVVVVSAEE